ncbi:PPA1309 family protein [Cryptosporangium minutisporangium]|uniref:PPA1309 family protein n=1 Tax=Cryptosporangium minutisporangium TaxID=113569 RepID=A0ABP6T4M6_9ACTN
MSEVHSGMNGAPLPDPLHAVVLELERHANAGGWDQPPALYALVDTAELLAAEPGLADQVGLSATEIEPGSITPVEQESLGDAPLDETLARIAWPESVLGCALVQEVLVLPPDAEDARPDDADPVDWAANHADRREVRMVAGVLRDGTSACALRMRPHGDAEPNEVVYGADLAPNLVVALRATLD